MEVPPSTKKIACEGNDVKNWFSDPVATLSKSNSSTLLSHLGFKACHLLAISSS